MSSPFDLTGNARGLRDALVASGLSAPSAHARLGDGADLDRVFEAAATVGVHTVVHPFSPPERWTSKDGVDAVAEDVAAALERAAGDAFEGIAAGYDYLTGLAHR